MANLKNVNFMSETKFDSVATSDDELYLVDYGDIDFVVEYKVNADGSWCRKYRSGWLEQGGQITMNDSTNLTVAFPKKFANTNYTWKVQGIRTTGQDAYAWQCGIYENYTTSSMQIRNSSNGTMVICWEVKGQGAEEE